MANPKIQLRHDTAANWTSINPVLLEGEVGIETDTRKQKFGDGTTAWNSLPYDAGSTALQSDSIVTPLSYRASGISTTVIGTIDSDGYLNGATSSVEAEFVPETTVAPQIIFNDVFSFNSHSAWTNDAVLNVVFSEPFTVGNTTTDELSLYVTRYGTIYFIIGDDYIYTPELIGASGTYDSEINLVLTFTDSGDNWTIGTGVTNFDGSTWKYGNSSGTCTFSRIGTNTVTIPKTAKIKKFVLCNSAQSRMDTINTSVQIGTTIYTINSDSAGLKLSYNSDNLKVNNNNQLDTVVELSELATQNWVTNQGYLTAITSSNVTNALGYTPVNKAGDTMSGNLTIDKSNPNFIVKDSRIDFTTNPSNNIFSVFSALKDANNVSVGEVWHEYRTDGSHSIYLQSRKSATDNTTYSILKAGWDANGNAYSSFPNTTCCDGQWVQTEIAVASNYTLSANTANSWTLNDIPNDGHEYEVQGTVTASGSNIIIILYSSKISKANRIITTDGASGVFVFPLSTDRKIGLRNWGTDNATINYFRVHGYRRIGTNA